MHFYSSWYQWREWLQHHILFAVGMHQRNNEAQPTLHVPVPDNLPKHVNHWALSSLEQQILFMALVPHIAPEVYDLLNIPNPETHHTRSEYGGWLAKYHSGILPTVQTAVFLLGGTAPARHQQILELLLPDAPLLANNLITVTAFDDAPNAPFISRKLEVTPEFLSLALHGKPFEPSFSTTFPAKKVSTQMEWDDLILAPDIKEELREIEAWLQHGPTMLNDWGMGRQIAPGYKSLFYGQPGTGKSLCAKIIGKNTNRPVYRIDLSWIISKYIGETEKNLKNVFDQAESHDWILFFDEADALFGKRTSVSSSNDRYGNQEVAYLLQCMEDYPGLVILATNLKTNIDDAFARRFQAAIEFPMPAYAERLQLWQRAFPAQCPPEAPEVLESVAEAYEISGGTIINAVRTCTLKALAKGAKAVTETDLLQANYTFLGT